MQVERAEPSQLAPGVDPLGRVSAGRVDGHEQPVTPRIGHAPDGNTVTMPLLLPLAPARSRTRRSGAAHLWIVELLLARNPDRSSSLPYLLRLPLEGGLVFRTRGTWPRTSALYCHPIGVDEWPVEPEIVERVALRVCARRGAAIDVVCDRGREQRSQIVFTRARGREVVFWQSPRTRKQSRPDVRVPTTRAQGIEALEIIVDAHERYPYRFATQQVRTVRRGLVCGDYAISQDGRIVCAVERKSVDDLVSSLASGRLRFALGELSGLTRAAVVVEEGYARVFAQRICRARRSPMAWPSCRSAIRTSRSCTATRASWPRSGPTAFSPPRMRGRVRSRLPGPASVVSAATGHPRSSLGHRRRRRRALSCARGHARTGWPSRTADVSAATS